LNKNKTEHKGKKDKKRMKISVKKYIFKISIMGINPINS